MSAAPQVAKPPLRDLIWQVPLVPVAVAVTAGLLADRYIGIPLAVAALGLLISFVAWFIAASRKLPNSAIALWCVAGFLAAAYHHGWRNDYAGDDVGEFATAEPKLVRVRGILSEEPTIALQPHHNPLASFDRDDPTKSVLDVRQIRADGEWITASGKARLVVQGHLEGFHVGDEIETIGWLSSPPAAENPGEWDRAEFLRDQRIRAELYVRKTPDAVTRLAEGWSSSPMGWLARLRGWGQAALERTLPKQQAAVASALLLGENSAMTAGESLSAARNQ